MGGEIPGGTVQQFSAIDYIIFICLLSFSALVGVYYGFIAKRKQDNTSEYILGSRSMTLFPIAVSLIVSNISGMTILGYPVDIYLYGAQIWTAAWTANIAVVLLVNYIYLPVFYEMQSQSCYAYLERRFDKRVKSMASIFYAISAMFFLPVVIFIPSLALNQVTGISVTILSMLGCGVCVFYTTIGGLRAVVWTDAIQYILMMGAILSVMYLGNDAVGGLSNTFAAAKRGHRLELFNFDPSPFVRTTFWSAFIGMTIHLLGNIGISPVLVQRCLSLSDRSKAKWSVWICFGGMTVFFSYAFVTGLQMYAKYETCDPTKAGIIAKPDQTLALFVLEVGRAIPGLSGLFISGVMAAALSTISSSLNTMSGTIYEDFLKSRFPLVSEKTASNIMKLIVLILGITIALLAIIVEHLGSVFQVAIIVGSVSTGSLLGLFTLGMTCRTANSKGAIWGGISSIMTVTFIMVGAQILNTANYPKLPMRTDGCKNATQLTFNWKEATSTVAPNSNIDGSFWIFRISFVYYSTVGFLICIIVGYIVSRITGGCKQQVDDSLLTPFKRRTRPSSK